MSEMDGTGSGTVRERRKALLEREIKDKACTLFARKGFDGTSLTDIADAVGLSRAAIYYYFENKEALLEAIVAEVSERPIQTLLGCHDRAAAGPAEELRDMVRRHVVSVIDRQVLMRMIAVTEAALPPALAARHAASKRRYLEDCRRIIRDGIRAGVFRPVDDRVAALAVIGMAAWTAQWHSPDRPPAPAELAEIFADMAVRALETDRSDSPAGSIDALLDGMRNQIGRLEQML
ncbi:TetR/AcrR family transcriptional regulator [Tistrella mobilis]|uniref:Transcriptional regulator n=1 Tax=Tistrella mobilis (strain KA081020-065) TaxID=1110502 RepID=I3TSQ1_TISMK|nr:TetR/AcrR family transcriptional regulator [Tistrella mobilis]AFK55789.1 putative transcriptional regulator [Tistrella mobilis KA081020-065]